MRGTSLKACGVLVLALGALATVGSPSVDAAQKAHGGARQADAATASEHIWRDPGDMASLDLIYGAGGKAHAPEPGGTFTFVKEDLLETSPKFEVTDGQGVAWKVKMGEESQAETAATRFLWAAGYFVDEDYYLAELAVTGLQPLHRGQKFVSSGGIVHGVRLERRLPDVKKLENWDWFDNPFVGQRELNGLRVMMSLLNNWDLKKVNNSVYAVGGERDFVVTDVGATFGNTGNPMTRSKSVPAEYEDSKFIAKDRPDFMDFVMHSRPFFVAAVDVPNYRVRTRMEDVTRHIPRADAHWLGERLSMLSDDQIRDGFRTAGYGPAAIEMLTTTIRQRIAALEAL